MSAAWADVILTAILTVAGLWLARSYGRQIRVSLANRRLDAYAALWERTGLAAPVRLDQKIADLEDRPWSLFLSIPDRRRLYAELTAWYYSDGNGMLLSKQSRSIYLAAKNNLICPDRELDPKELRGHFECGRGSNWALTREERGCLSIRQLSLLRAQMKADLAIHGVPFISSLQMHELAFLIGLDVNVLKRPWRYALPSHGYFCILKMIISRSRRRRTVEDARALYGCLNEVRVRLLDDQTMEDPSGVKRCEQPATGQSAREANY